MGFTTCDVMDQSTEMSPLVSMLFRTFLNPLKFLMEIFYINFIFYITVSKDSNNKYFELKKLVGRQ